MIASNTPIPTSVSDFLFDVGDIIALHNVVPALLFVIFYAKGGAWTTNFVGRSLMTLGVAQVITQAVLSASLFFGPDYFGREFVRILGYAPAGIALWAVFLALRVVQKAPEGTDFSVTPGPFQRRRQQRAEKRRQKQVSR